MGFVIQEAKRELIWTKTALMAPSGGGKTYSALRLATGMLEKLKELGQAKNGKILLGNTEQKRGYYYANEFKYDIVDIGSPHHPDKYVEFIEFAVEQGYPILILDSTTHEWEGKGGCLELHQKAGGTYQSWAKVTPLHDKFIIAIADSPIHVIATMRGKDQYEMEKVDNKNVVKKLGVGARQRDGFEYEFTLTFNIDQKTNLATVQKDNTHLFENDGDVKLSEKHGADLITWANSGQGFTPAVRDSKNEVDSIDELKDKSVELGVALGGVNNKKLMALLKEMAPNGNPKKLNNLSKLQELVEKLQEMKDNMDKGE